MGENSPPTLVIPDQPPPLTEADFDLNNVEVIDDLNINRWLMRIMRLGASFDGYNRGAGSISSSSSGSKSRRLSITGAGAGAADTSASNLLRPPNTSRGRRFSDSINFDGGNLARLQKVARKGKTGAAGAEGGGA